MGLNFYSTTISHTFKSVTNIGTFISGRKSSINGKKNVFEKISRAFKSIFTQAFS